MGVSFNINSERRGQGALAMLLLFVLYYGAVVGFSHTHIVDNEVITHSHPYSNPSHTHSSGMLEISQVLSTIIVIVAAIASLPAKLVARVENIIYKVASFIGVLSAKSSSSRAPPVLC